MKITNNANLPQPIFNAINRQFHKKEGYSVTELIQPIQLTKLKKTHEKDIVEDASDRIWALMGSAIHEVISKGENKNALTEEFLTTTIGGIKISGMPDYYADGILQDFKFTSVWNVIYDSMNENYQKQLSMYAYLLEEHGFKVDKTQIVYILRDWSKTKAMADHNYPQSQVVVKDFDRLPDIKEWMEERVSLLEGDTQPPCTDEDMWSKKDVYAVMKEGRKSALKLFEKEEEAKTFLTEQKGSCSVVKRTGERTRCESYCPVKEFCQQYKSYKENAE